MMKEDVNLWTLRGEMRRERESAEPSSHRTSSKCDRGEARIWSEGLFFLRFVKTREIFTTKGRR